MSIFVLFLSSLGLMSTLYYQHQSNANVAMSRIFVGAADGRDESGRDVERKRDISLQQASGPRSVLDDGSPRPRFQRNDAAKQRVNLTRLPRYLFFTNGFALAVRCVACSRARFALTICAIIAVAGQDRVLWRQHYRQLLRLARLC